MNRWQSHSLKNNNVPCYREKRSKIVREDWFYRSRTSKKNAEIFPAFFLNQMLDELPAQYPGKNKRGNNGGITLHNKFRGMNI